MKKLILLILVCSLALLAFVGCNDNTIDGKAPLSSTPEENADVTTPENTTEENTTPENTPNETTPQDQNTQLVPPVNDDIPTPNESGLFGDRTGTVVMDVLVQIPVSSWYGLEVEIESDGNIYLNDILYENTGVFETPELVYLDPIPQLAKENEELAKTLEKIQNAKSCYVLETKGAERYGKTISVYYIENTYYFLDKYEGEVTRIWCENKNTQITPETPPEVTPPVSNVVPAPDGEKPFGSTQTSFTADVFAQDSTMSSRFSLEVRIDNDKIYLGKTLYECVGTLENPTITYIQSLLWDVEKAENAEEKLEILEKIKNSKTCYVLKPVGTDNGKTIVLYYVDGVYYFSDSINGKPSRIHYAVTNISQ